MPHLCVIAQVPEECPEAVAQLIEQCLEKEVSARPNARQVSEPNYFKHALKLVCMTKHIVFMGGGMAGRLHDGVSVAVTVLGPSETRSNLAR